MPIALRVTQADFAVPAKELIETRTGEAFTITGERNYERRFLVRATNRNIGAATAPLCEGVPKPYTPYVSPDGKEIDQLAVATSYRAERQDANKFENWIVTVGYSTVVPDGGIPEVIGFGSQVRGAQNEPWLMRPVIEWDWEETTHYPSRDLKGKPYVNSAYMPFSPAPGFPAAYQILVVTRNEPTWSRQLASKYAYAVNSDTFLGAEPGTVLSLPPRVKIVHRGTQLYFNVTFRLKFNLPLRYRRENDNDPAVKEGVVGFDKLQSWQPQILDKGTHQLPINTSGVPYRGQPIPIIRYNAPVTRDVLLNGAGRESKRANPDDAAELVKAYFLDFTEYHAVPLRPIIEGGIGGTGGRPLGGL